MLDRAKFRAASQSFKLLFMKTLQSEGALSPSVVAALQMVMKIPEPDFKGLYRWMEGLPIMRQWIGDRQAVALAAKGFEVLQKPWESTLNVLRDDIKFDRLGGYRPAIMSMANELNLLPYREMIRVMNDAFSGTIYGNCYDGYPIISASHVTGSNAGTAAMSHSALDAAILAMEAQTDATNGDSLLVEPTHMWFHKTLKPTAEDILDRRYVSDGETSSVAHDNKHYKKLIPISLPLASGMAAYWGLFSMQPGQELRPILWQFDPNGQDFISLDKNTDEANFTRRELKYGTEDWGAAAPAFPQFIWGSTGAG